MQVPMSPRKNSLPGVSVVPKSKTSAGGVVSVFKKSSQGHRSAGGSTYLPQNGVATRSPTGLLGEAHRKRARNVPALGSPSGTRGGDPRAGVASQRAACRAITTRTELGAPSYMRIEAAEVGVWHAARQRIAFGARAGHDRPRSYARKPRACPQHLDLLRTERAVCAGVACGARNVECGFIGAEPAREHPLEHEPIGLMVTGFSIFKARRLKLV